MSIRTTSRTISFSRPFVLTGIADEQPPGSYTVEIDEEPLPHVSFPAYRRIATLMRLPPRPSSTERARVVDLDPLELAALLAADARAEDKPAAFPSGAATQPQQTTTRAVERFTAWKIRWHSWLVLNVNALAWTALLASGFILTAVFASARTTRRRSKQCCADLDADMAVALVDGPRRLQLVVIPIALLVLVVAYAALRALS